MAVTQGSGGGKVNTITQVLTSAPGAPGLSAYQVWLNLGNVGSEIDYQNSLKVKGDTGEKGDTGNTGEKGETGNTGPIYEDFATRVQEAILTNPTPIEGNAATRL